MSIQRFGTILTAVNLGLLLFLLVVLAQLRPTVAAQTIGPILRARALELVDEHNVVRMRLNVKQSEIDLFDRTGAIGVKLGAGEDGSGLVIGAGGTDPTSRAHVQTYVQIIARLAGTAARPTTRIMLKGAEGQERVITP